MFQMDDSQQWLVNDHKRYMVRIPNFYKSDGHIVYETQILDTAYLRKYIFFFRFKMLRDFHKKLLKQAGHEPLPEYPKTNSFGFWHKTNSSLTLIRERVRQLEYYLTQVLNNPKTMELPQAKLLKNAFRTCQNSRKRSASCDLSLRANNKAIKECPQFYKRELSSQSFN